MNFVRCGLSWRREGGEEGESGKRRMCADDLPLFLGPVKVKARWYPIQRRRVRWMKDGGKTEDGDEEEEEEEMVCAQSEVVG